MKFWSFTVDYKEVCFDAKVFCVFTIAASGETNSPVFNSGILYQAENSPEPAAASACFIIWCLELTKVYALLNCSFTKGEVLKSQSFLSNGNCFQALVYS